MTIGAIILVDRKGRKFLLSLGTAGVIVSLACTGSLFKHSEALRVDCRQGVQAMVTTNQTVSIAFNQALSTRLLDFRRESRQTDCRKTDIHDCDLFLRRISRRDPKPSGLMASLPAHRDHTQERCARQQSPGIFL